ncbi:TonB-dependent receptor plug domain-containing protein [Acinetobacter sp. CAAS 2-6]|uniref:TonB-dependent receptor plug domain-containing protein n=1 Tax=Acinetobacter sp. CAAS 2-6 TaxID=3016358 RepID=UPI002DD6B86C|nr:TonB-dependent receptor [Acinetobacter sp. CAAS 2-6]
MSISLQPTALVGAIAMAMGFSSSVSAQPITDQNTVNASLETLVVTATRSEEKIGDVPVRISAIDKNTIQQSSIADLGQLLQRDAGLTVVQSGGIGQTSSLFIRGADSNYSLFLKDGISLNTALDGGASIPYIDLSDAVQIEVLKGPGSVQYGTDAIGGVINIRTAPPEKQQLFITGEIAENNTYKTVVGADLVNDGIYAQIRSQRLESDGTPVTNKDTEHASYDQKGYSAKLGYEKERYATSFNISENKGTNVYYGGLNDFLNRLISLNGRYNLTSGLSLNMRYSNFKDELTGKSYFYYFNTERNEADANIRWQYTDHQNLLIGTSINNADIESLSILGRTKSLDTTGYYLQHQYNDGGIHTQAGLRIEDNDQFGTHTVGQLAGRYNLNSKTSIYSNLGTGFKAPTGNQLFYSSSFYDSQRNETYITNGNIKLKPEESVSYEIGVDHQLTHNLLTYASVYQTKVKNLIEYTSDYSLYPMIYSTYENVSKAKMTGGEIGLKWKKDDLFLTTEYAYVKTKNEDSGLELIRRPKQSLTLTTGLENKVYGLSASLIAKSSSKTSNYPPQSESTPGYMTIDLNTYWNINPNIKLFTNIKNIGDVKYKTAKYYKDEFYINGGRLASAGITFRY